MIPLDTFLRCVKENVARIHGYELGNDGSSGKSDCIGLIIGALSLAGFRWPGVHGSNWAARNAMTTPPGLRPTSPDRGGVFLGEIVYKAKSPGDYGYALPDRYKDSGDLRDYYHVGVVTGIDPLEITHCTSAQGGIKEDKAINNWRWGGKLKYVDYDEQEEPDMETPYQAKVTAESGNTVNLRAKPDKKSTIIARAHLGETVTVLDELDEWDQVSYQGKTGYMMTKFLRSEQDETGKEPDGETVTVSRADLETWADVLEEMARDIRDALGQG